MPTLTMTSWETFHTWKLIDPNDDKRVIRHQPWLTCRSMTTILDAVRAGLGFWLPLESACEADLQAGRLVRVLPEWQSEESQFYIVFTMAGGTAPGGKSADRLSGRKIQASLTVRRKLRPKACRDLSDWLATP